MWFEVKFSKPKGNTIVSDMTLTDEESRINQRELY
jgi:hypothetical protein